MIFFEEGMVVGWMDGWMGGGCVVVGLRGGVGMGGVVRGGRGVELKGRDSFR